ncbi:hypothetical protein [Gordonia spumicola]|nr:hypothetical protein [Gordonia spumicola]
MNHDDPTADLTDRWLVEAVRDDVEPDSDVERLISSISSGLAAVRRPARRLAADAPGVWVSDRVVKQLIAVSVRRSIGRLVVFASVDGAEDHVDAVRMGLVARYADDLVDLSERVRDVVDEVLTSTIGPDVSGPARSEISVRWQDLYTREWLD